MKKKRIDIRLAVPVTPGLTHQLRNCAEEIFRQLRGVRFAEVENMDSAIDTIWVKVQSESKVRATLKIINQCLADELLDDR